MKNSNVPPVERFKVVQEYMRDIPCKLTTEEHLERAREQADLPRRKMEHKANAEQVKADLKAHEKFLENEEKRLAQIVTTGIETRKIRCVERFDFDRNVREVRRLDMPEDDRRGLVEETPLSPSERQHQLDIFAKEQTKKQRADDEAAQKVADEEKAKGEGAVVTKIRPPYPNEQH